MRLQSAMLSSLWGGTHTSPVACGAALEAAEASALEAAVDAPFTACDDKVEATCEAALL